MPDLESVEVTLFQWKNGEKTGYTETVTLTPDENGIWKHTWTKLPYADDDGVPFTYTVAETAAHGWTATYSPNNAGAGESFGTITIYNTPSLYTLPETGGGGVSPVLVTAGMLILATFGAGIFLLRGRGREGRSPR